MYKLTLDLGLMAEGTTDVFIRRLVQWKEAGLVELIPAGAASKSAAPQPYVAPPVSRFGTAKSRSAPIAGSGNATFKNLAGILFPNRDLAKLRMTEINQVVYLIKHHATKNDIFVTADAERYIDDGHRQRLREAYGILTMTPREVVEQIGKDERVAAASK
jgi:hypothetical protein